MAKGQKWEKPKKVYRVHIKSWDLFEEGGEAYTEYFHHYEDILYDELDADVVSDFYIFNDWLLWGENSDWEIEKVEEVEIWSWKEFRNSGRWRNFYADWGYGEKLHL